MVRKSGLIITLLIISLAFLVYAEDENTTEPEFNTTSEENTTDITGDVILETTEINETVEENITDFDLTSFTPKEFKVNTDAQFNIQIYNNGTTELKNLMALVTGSGFSTSDVTPIDSLKPGEKSYILVMGSFKQQGDIELTIRINDKTFKQAVSVINPFSEEAKKLEEQQEQKDEELTNLSLELKELKTNFTILEKDLKTKKDEEYDISDIQLSDLKTFLRNAESSIIAKDLEQARISMTLGLDEYYSVRDKINNAEKIKVPLLDKVKNNIMILSAIAASIITLVSFYELMKKKKAAVVETVSESIKSVKDKKSTENKEEIDKS